MQRSTFDIRIQGYHFEKRSEMRQPKKTSLNRSTPRKPARPTHVFYIDDIEIDYQTGLDLESCALDYLYPYHDEVQDHDHYKACAKKEFLEIIGRIKS